MKTERQEIVIKLGVGRAQDLTPRELELIIGALQFADFAHRMIETVDLRPKVPHG